MVWLGLLGFGVLGTGGVGEEALVLRDERLIQFEHASVLSLQSVVLPRLSENPNYAWYM